MAGEILEHSRPIQGVKITSRIERERYRTVLLLSAILIVDNDIYEYLRELQHR